MTNDSVISIWKNSGMTSFDVIRKVKSQIGDIKIGHCGTLDPFAEGILILCLGSSTKNISKYTNYEKEYVATIILGEETDTLDKTGKIINKKEVPDLSEKNVEEKIESFKGETLQIPPYFSALKFQGMRLYDFARQDIFIRKKPRMISIDDIKLLELKNNELKIYVKCSKGTYIRSLARDIAYKLDTVGHLISLKRIAVGPYSEKNALKIEEVNNVYSN